MVGRHDDVNRGHHREALCRRRCFCLWPAGDWRVGLRPPPKKMDGYLGANGRRLPQSLRSFAMTYSGHFFLHGS